MKLDSRHKAFVAALTLTMGALVVDRLFVLPASTLAQTVSGSDSVISELLLDVTNSPAQESAATALSGRLEALRPKVERGQERDAFALPASWLAESRPSVDLASRPGALDTFAARHHLSGVIISGQSRLAVVDDRVVAVGQELDGYRLVAIDEDSATFEVNQTRFVVPLAEDR